MGIALNIRTRCLLVHGAVKVCEGATCVPATRPLHFKHDKKQEVSGVHSQLSFTIKTTENVVPEKFLTLHVHVAMKVT